MLTIRPKERGSARYEGACREHRGGASSIRLGLLICLVLQGFASSAQTADPDPLFAAIEPLEITLTGPFDRIDDERDKEQEYEGSLSYADSDGNTVTLDARFEVRGNWRLDPSNCSYSQLWVDLRRGQLPGTLFENQNRLKLVVQCRRQDRYAGYIQRELQAYRIFSQLSELNFDTRELMVTYVDSEEEDSTRTHSAFFIEHQNRLSDRFQMAEVEVNLIDVSSLDPLQGTLVSLFMYFVGNTDFSMVQGPPDDECCHNSKLLTVDGTYYPIPYDFDASGFIDASYAPEPLPQFNLRSNRSRLYRGFCVEPEVFNEAVARFRAIEDDVTAMVTERRNIRFVEDFFETLNDPRDLEREIAEECR